MYGLLLENLAEYIRMTYGEEKWEEIRRLAHVDQPTFSTHRVYSDSVIPRLAQKASKVLNMSENVFFENMGRVFVEFVSQYGYDRVLSILGRHMRDFLNGLDNLHEYLKFSYPRMKAPSFFCENENEYGLTLHYRSKRKGYVYYTMGQIKEVGRRFYHTEVTIDVVKEELLFDTTHVTFQLHFENTAYLVQYASMQRSMYLEQLLPVQSRLFFEIFPFCIVFASDMVIRNIGHSLYAIMPDLIGRKVTDAFNLARPLIDFTWNTVRRRRARLKVLLRTNNIFELVTHEPLKKGRSEEVGGAGSHQEAHSDTNKDGENSDNDEAELDNHAACLSLKGQMLYMEEWKSIIYLGTPMMQDLGAMVKAGLFINDLSMHDFSRDLMLAGTQQSVELKLALDQEQHKSKRLEESMKKLDEEMKRTDELLYQMIPKAVADRLRRGAPAVSTCQVFDGVTILFSDVVTFTQICSRISPMEVVSLLNSMYSIFDKLTSLHQVYKVETIGDAYMVVSGAPEKRQNHAEKVCDMALDMMHGITGLMDPSTGDSISIRIGVHSGTVVAGVVGLKMPRYCLFGDTVNTASRMESTSEPMKIHISESTRELLGSSDFEIRERGTIAVKGKGDMKTYWLERRIHPKVDRLEPVVDVDERASHGGYSPILPGGHRSRSPSPEGRFSPDSRSVYSPVTFVEVARHRQMSPVRPHANTWNNAMALRDRTYSGDADSVPSNRSPRPRLSSACVAAGMSAFGLTPFSSSVDLPSSYEHSTFRYVQSTGTSITTGQADADSQLRSVPRKSRHEFLSDVKPTAILFPCLHRNVAPALEQEPGVLAQVSMQSPMDDGRKDKEPLTMTSSIKKEVADSCHGLIIQKRKAVVKSHYCSAL